MYVSYTTNCLLSGKYIFINSIFALLDSLQNMTLWGLFLQFVLNIVISSFFKTSSYSVSLWLLTIKTMKWEYDLNLSESGHMNHVYFKMIPKVKKKLSHLNICLTYTTKK